MKKKLLALILTLALLLGAAEAEFLFSEDESLTIETEESATLPTELNVVNTTKVTGAFFTDLWSGNTSDIDVRKMLHGFSTAQWVTEAEFSVNPTVVKNVRYEVTDNGNKTYYITIADNLKFSDGSDITAYEFAFSILLQTSPYLTELGAAETAYTYILGYDDYHSGKSEQLTGVRVYSKQMFSITVAASALPFFYEESYIDVTPYPIVCIAPNCTVTDTGSGCMIKSLASSSFVLSSEGNRLNNVTFGTEMLKETLFGEDGYATYPAVVAGPYTLTGYDAETGHVEFKKNPYYSGNYEGVTPSIENITLSYAVPEAAMQGMLDGTYNLYNKAVSSEIITEGMSSGMQYATYGRRGMGFINFACEKQIMSDVAVRRAIAYCLDKSTFISDYLGTFGMEVYGYYGISQWMVQAATGVIQLENVSDEVVLEDLNLYEYSLDDAREVLEEAGWKLNSNTGIREKEISGETVQLSLTYALAIGSNASKYISGMLAEACAQVGIEINVVEVTFDELIDDMLLSDDRKFDMYMLGANFDRVFDPSLSFSTDERLFGLANICHYVDEKLEELALNMRSREENDVSGYYLAWYEFQKYYVEVLPQLPIYSDVYVDFYTDALKNYDISSDYSWASAIIYAEFATAESETEAAGDSDFLF